MNFIKIKEITRLAFTAMANIVDSSDMLRINNLFGTIRRINKNC